MKLKILEQEYEECLKAVITTDADHFQGLETVLKQGLPQVQNHKYQIDRDSGNSSENEANKDKDDEDEEDGDGFDQFQEGGYQQLGSDQESVDNEEEDQKLEENPAEDAEQSEQAMNGQ